MLGKLTSTILRAGTQTLEGLQRRLYSNVIYNTVPQVFDRIKTVSSSQVVAEVGAVYHFKVTNDKCYVVDLKNGEGSVNTGEPEEKPEVTIIINSENLLKMFNRELQPANAFMTGKLTVKGDLSKALALEKIMKAAREAGK